MFLINSKKLNLYTLFFHNLKMYYVSTACLKGNNSRFTKDVFKVLDVYAKAGIKNIELGAAHYPFDNIKDLINYRKEHDANFIMHYNFPAAKNVNHLLNLGSKNKNIVDISLNVIKNGLELCNELEAPIYSLHPGFTADLDTNLKPLSEEISKEKAVSLIISRLKEVIDFAQDYDIKIAVENMVPSCVSFCKIEDFLRLFKEIKNKQLGVLLDIGHLKLSNPNFEKQKDFIEKIKDKIFELHIHQLKNGIDHQPMLTKNVIELFNIDAKKVALTLEINNANIEQIKQSYEILNQY